MRKIQLTQGQVALVDDDMFEELSQHKWYALKHGGTFYARRNTKISDKETATVIMMHHVIAGKPPKGMVSDHINGCATDNRRENLRFVTYRQNQQNRRDREVVRSSRYPGVHWCNRDKRWVAKLTINGKAKFIHQSTSELIASEAYQRAIESLGESVIDSNIDPYHNVYQKITNDLNIPQQDAPKPKSLYDYTLTVFKDGQINVQVNGKEEILGFFMPQTVESLGESIIDTSYDTPHNIAIQQRSIP